MGDTVIFESVDGDTEEINTETEDVVNLHVNEDKNAVVVKYHDRREIIPMHRVYRVVERNHH